MRTRTIVATLFLAAVAVPARAQVYPGASWTSKTPAEVGLDASKLNTFANNVGGVGCIVKGGYMVKTWGSQTSKADWASAMKPVMSTILFFAIKEGKLNSVDAPVRPWVQQVFPGKDLIAKDRTMTFRHLADMISGYSLPENPGAAWGYNDHAINLYSKTLFDGVFGQTPNAVATHSSRLGPLQFQDGSLFGSRSGYGVRTSVRDFARIGWFWLHKGKWKGTQILPASYFDNYMKPDVSGNLPRTAGGTNDYLNVYFTGGGTDQTPHGPGIYGFNWWFNAKVGTTNNLTWPDAPADAFQANGHWNKEVMTVIPSLKMVVAARGSWGTFNPGSSSAGMNQNLKLLKDSVLSSSNTPPSASDYATTTPYETNASITLSYTDPDGPGPFAITIVSSPTNGTLSGTGTDRTYAPDAGFSGTDTFTWKVHDGQADSNTATVTVTVNPAPLPAAPTNLSASAVSSSQIDLSWTDTATNETGFTVERLTGTSALSVTLKTYAGGNTAPTVEAAGTSDSFQNGARVVNDRGDTWTSVPSLLSGSTRLLTARNDRTEAPVDGKYVVTLSASATIFLPLDPRYGGAKATWMDGAWTDSGLNADSSALSGWKVWTRSVTGAGDITLGCDTGTYDGVCYAFAGGGSWTTIASLGANATSYSDGGLADGTTYSYRVKATSGAGDSLYSNIASDSTPPSGPDSDGDGLPDTWETGHFGNIAAQDGNGDPDADSLTNLQEYTAGTDPNDPDSDADGLTDAQEVLSYGTNPLDGDSDSDGMTDGDEVTYALDPLNGDQDNNAIPDGQDDWNGNGDTNQTDISLGVSPGSPPTGGIASGGGSGGGGGGCGATGLEILPLLALMILGRRG